MGIACKKNIGVLVINYILYKLLNNIIYNIYLIFFRDRGKNIHKHAKIFLDINHKTTHLGDRLFFWDLINFENHNGRAVFIDTNDAVSHELFNSLGLKVEFLRKKDVDTKFISLKSKFLSDFFKNPLKVFSVYYLDFYKIKGPLSKEILKSIRNPEGIDLPVLFRPKILKIDQTSNKVVIFNNYVDSGKFRLGFIKVSKLNKRAEELANQGFEIWHVGSRNDKVGDKSDYPFVSQDMRGKTSLKELIEYFSTDRISSVVSYDNFFLHLAELYEIPSEILFRGRFLKSARTHHFNSVNIGLTRTISKINYL